MAIILPRLYAIVDQACLRTEAIEIKQFVGELIAVGVTLIQYRNKFGDAREILGGARELKRMCVSAPGGMPVRLIMNDRADLCLAAGFDGVHLGQDDLSPVAARAILSPDKWVGISTHSATQVKDADRWPVDYIAIGPVFATATKANHDPVIGLEGIRTARAITPRPLVAIGGITRENCREVIDAGADCVAVIADLLHDPKQAAEECLRLLESG